MLQGQGWNSGLNASLALRLGLQPTWTCSKHMAYQQLRYSMVIFNKGNLRSVQLNAVGLHYLNHECVSILVNIHLLECTHRLDKNNVNKNVNIPKQTKCRVRHRASVILTFGTASRWSSSNEGNNWFIKLMVASQSGLCCTRPVNTSLQRNTYLQNVFRQTWMILISVHPWN